MGTEKTTSIPDIKILTRTYMAQLPEVARLNLGILGLLNKLNDIQMDVTDLKETCL